jgi:methionyl-tRNA synthetase
MKHYICRQMIEPKRYLVTAALPYANGPIHIGHLAGCYLPADVYVRYLRSQQKEVVFICGSDEHGMAITMRARQEGKTPHQIIDHYHQIMKDSLHQFGISFDNYSRTSLEIHHQTARDFFLKLYHDSRFEEKTNAQYYDEKTSQFLADRYIKGTCPKCGHDEAYGDQCEKCGSSLHPQDLIQPISVLSGETPGLKETTNWYFPLNQYQTALEEFLKEKESYWKPNVYGQCMSWLKEGLQPRAMTRDLNWGVKVPLPHAQDKVLYVWFDAPIGYISATKELLPHTWETYWKNQDTALIHFIGKDNIVFHCIIFPAMLMAHGGFILPHHVPANEFLNLEGKKISTSKNWAVWLHEYLLDFPDKQDELRFVLLSIAPETSDSEFTWKDFQSRVNNELVAILGNFIHRVATLIHKLYDGVLPIDVSSCLDPDVKEAVEKWNDQYHLHTSNHRLRQGLSAIMELARFGNKYLTQNEPWKKVKTHPEDVKVHLMNGYYLSAHIAKLMAPYMPESSEKIFHMLHLSSSQISVDTISAPKGHPLNEVQLLFQKIEDADMQFQKEKLTSGRVHTPSDAQQKQIEESPLLSFEDFSKADLRVGTVLSAVPVPKTDKLLELLVDIGHEKRTIVSGIAAHYTPDNIIGKQVLVITNLAPRKIRGIESKGMLLMAENSEKLSILSPENRVNPGAKVS